MILVLQGCKMSGTYSVKENSKTMLQEGYYKDLLYDPTQRSGDPCVQKWRDEHRKETYNLPNGNFVYVVPLLCDCMMHWEIKRKTEKVVAYTSEGKTCYRLNIVQKPNWYRRK